MSVRIISFVFVCMLMATCTGCLTLFSKTEIHRGDEQRLPVQFQTGRAARLFYDDVAKRDKSIGDSRFGIPFVTFYSKSIKLSDNAFFNEQVRICDTNQDGMITEQEAEIYGNHAMSDMTVSPNQVQTTSFISVGSGTKPVRK